MSSYNRAIIVGNLTRDVELKDVGGTPLGSFCVAVNESYKDKQGAWVEKAVFIDVDVWGNSAPACNQYLSKGSQALVEGKLQMDTWEKDGQKFSKLKIRADKVQFLGSKEATGQAQSASVPNGARDDSDNLPF